MQPGQYEELQRRPHLLDQSCARNLHGRKSRPGGSGRAVAAALRWVRGVCGTSHGVASREGTVGDRAHPCTGASRTGADGAQGEENLPGVGKTPLASLHSSLCLPKRCAAGLETGDERETSLADGYVHRQRTGAVSATWPPEKRGHAGSNGLVSGSHPVGTPARGARPGEKDSRVPAV